MIRSANAIPANMQPKAGSTLVVPKTTLGSDVNIGQDIADNAVLALEPDHFSYRPSGQQAGARRQPAASPYARPAQRKAASRQ